MSERQDQNGREDDGDEHVGQQDLSVPMWVWTVLGFVLVVAVIIVVIIWGGGRAQPTDQGAGGQPETMSMTEPAPETMPAERPTTSATQPK